MKGFAWAAAIALVLASTPAWAASQAPAKSEAGKPAAQDKQVGAETTESFAIVSIRGKELLRLAPTSDHSAQARAEKVRERIHETLESNAGKTVSVKPSEITVEKSAKLVVLRLKNANLVTVTEKDAAMAGKSAAELAEIWASDLRDILAGLTVTAKEDLPKDFVTIATGEITRPAGGGAGTAPKPKK
jgi:hypothetical protein